MTFAIIYGFAEGPWIGKQFKTAMEDAGFNFAKDPTQADVVVAHSGGCYFLPETTKQQSIILIGPPYWPGKPLIISMFQKIYRDIKANLKEHRLAYWLRKSGWNIIYLFGDLIHALTLGRLASKHNFYERFKDDRLLIVRNSNDAWSTPHTAQLLAKFKAMKVHELPGEHDDCWTNPKPYVKLIKSWV